MFFRVFSVFCLLFGKYTFREGEVHDIINMEFYGMHPEKIPLSDQKKVTE